MSDHSRTAGDDPDRVAGDDTGTATAIPAAVRPRERRDSEDGGVEEFGPYMVYELLGQGGMATVHRAEKRGVGIRRPIALKRLLPHVAEDPELVQLFVDEARLASHLRHANVAQTYELGKVDDTFFIAMEFASGPTLSQIVRQCQKAAGEIPIAITVNILAQVCDALDYAHNLCDEYGQPLRIIHRDVSPGNIVVTNTGVVKLIDFGIAKATISSVKTQVGFIKGKFGYIAPEYMTGQIDARVDLFAMGVVAHEMLAGRRLFEGKDDFETLDNIRQLSVRPPSVWNSNVTPAVDDIVMTALARDPDKRWQTAHEMQVAFTNVVRELGVVVGGPQIVEWVDWAFSQVPRDAEQERAVYKAAGRSDTEQVAQVASPPPPRDDGFSIQFNRSRRGEDEERAALDQLGAQDELGARGGLDSHGDLRAPDRLGADGDFGPPNELAAYHEVAAHDGVGGPTDLGPLLELGAQEELVPPEHLGARDRLRTRHGLGVHQELVAHDELGVPETLGPGDDTRYDLRRAHDVGPDDDLDSPDDLGPDTLGPDDLGPDTLGPPDRLDGEHGGRHARSAPYRLGPDDGLRSADEPSAPYELDAPEEIGAVTGPYPVVRTPVLSEYNETAPLDRVLTALNNTPPPTPVFVPPPPLPLPAPPDDSHVYQIRPTPLPAALRGRDAGTEGSATAPIRPPSPQPARGARAGRPSAQPLPQSLAQPVVQPPRRRSMLWLILLMVALGVAAMATAYFWPTDL